MQTQAIGSAGVICAQCAVCQERFGNSSVISVLFCGHAFHQSCLNRWIASSSSCPQCRQPVRADRHVQRVYFDFCEFSESAQRELDAEQLVVERGQLRDELRSVRNDLKNAHEYAAELTNQLDKERRGKYSSKESKSRRVHSCLTVLCFDRKSHRADQTAASGSRFRGATQTGGRAARVQSRGEPTTQRD